MNKLSLQSSVERTLILEDCPDSDLWPQEACDDEGEPEMRFFLNGWIINLQLRSDLLIPLKKIFNLSSQAPKFSAKCFFNLKCEQMLVCCKSLLFRSTLRWVCLCVLTVSSCWHTDTVQGGSAGSFNTLSASAAFTAELTVCETVSHTPKISIQFISGFLLCICIRKQDRMKPGWALELRKMSFYFAQYLKKKMKRAILNIFLNRNKNIN